MDTALLIAGLIFPSVSLLLMLVAGRAAARGKHPSTAFVPFVGPIALTLWTVREGLSLWTIPVVWVLDVGTLAFLRAAPGLFNAYWVTRAVTRLAFYSGASGSQRATLSFHAHGKYVLQKTWTRPAGQKGIVALGEGGEYWLQVGVYTLTANHGLMRRLERQSDGRRRVVSQGGLPQTWEHYSLLHWDFHGDAYQGAL